MTVRPQRVTYRLALADPEHAVAPLLSPTSRTPTA
jgi:hypothetical protein